MDEPPPSAKPRPPGPGDMRLLLRLSFDDALAALPDLDALLEQLDKSTASRPADY
jgi:hypothetical protein